MDGNHARALLGVPPHAPEDQVRRAFRDAVRVAHPDRGGDPATFRQLVEARAVLSRMGCARRSTPYADASHAPRRPRLSLFDVERRRPVGLDPTPRANDFEQLLHDLLAA